MNALVLRELGHAYGTVQALHPLSLTMPRGELLGLIGPDGAGKTTLFQLLSTLLRPDTGQAEVLGFDLRRDRTSIRHRIGYMPGRFSLYTDLSVEENLQFFAALYGCRVQDQWDWIENLYRPLLPFAQRKAGQLSGGMKQKLALCCALVHRPELLLLDEPTTGVDPVSRRAFWDTLGHLRQQGLSLVVSTPYMDEAARCDRLALLQQGTLLGLDSPEGIRQSFTGDLYALRGPNLRIVHQQLQAEGGLRYDMAFGQEWHVQWKGAVPDHWKPHIQHISPTLEDAYLQRLQPAAL